MKLDIRESAYGRGVFAGEPIPAGALIAPFTGPFLRYLETNVDTYALQIGPDLYIGGSDDVDDLFNHSCEPNAGVFIDGRTVELHAIRDIAPGEQIAFDYSTTLDEEDFTMECRCGLPSCRGMIGDGRDLPEAVWQRYLALGILPAYVQESRRKGTAGRAAPTDASA